MSSNEGHTARSDSQEQYESAVLSFLNQEMAAVQPDQKQDEQTEDLDALVSDLLKQVIAESDQSQNNQQAIPDEMDTLLSEFPSSLEEAFPSNGKSSGLPVMPPAAPVNLEQGGSTKTAGEALKSPLTTIPETMTFRPLLLPRIHTTRIAFASVCLVALVLGGFYYFSRSSRSVSNIAAPLVDAAAPVVSSSPSQAMPASVQKPNKAESDKSPAVKQASTPLPAAPVQKPSASGTAAQQASGQHATKPAKVTPEPSMPKSAGKPASAAPDNEQKPASEKPPVAQAATATQAAAAPATAIERPAPPAISANTATATAAAEKRPALAAPAAPLTVENSAPGPQPPAPTPAVSRSLVPAVPISQTSAVYPEIALRTRLSGSVVLDLQIDEEGKVVKATPVSGPVMFHNAAVSAALKWRYRPASIGGKNVPSESRVRMNFNLR